MKILWKSAMLNFSNYRENIFLWKKWRKKVADYIYKGFRVHYEIEPMVLSNGLYRANGYVTYLGKETTPDLIRKFQTDSTTKIEVQYEIKQIICDYIDCERKEFIEIYDKFVPAEA